MSTWSKIMKRDCWTCKHDGVGNGGGCAPSADDTETYKWACAYCTYCPPDANFDYPQPEGTHPPCPSYEEREGELDHP